MRKILCGLLVLLLLPAVVSAQTYQGPYLSGPPSPGLDLSGATLPAARYNIEAAHAVDVRKYGAKCDGTTDDTAAIQAAVNANPGAAIALPENAACGISDTITIDTSYTTLTGRDGNSAYHNVGASCAAGPRLVWIGAAAATKPMVLVTSIAGDSTTQGVQGAGVTGIALCANGKAGYGLQVISIIGGQFTHLFVFEAMTAAYDFGSLLSSQLGDPTDTQRNEISDLGFYEVANAAPGFIFRGAGVAGAAGNFSKNTVRDIWGTYANGPGILCLTADNNVFDGIDLLHGAGGSGWGLEETNGVRASCRNNTWIGLGAPSGSVFRGGASVVVGGTATTGNVVTLSFSGSLPGLPQNASYTVQAGDTVQSIAAGLAAAINANATLTGMGLSAQSVVTTITITPAAAANPGEVTAAYTQGGNTETLAFTPSDGIMALVPAGTDSGTAIRPEYIIGTDATNNNPAPTIAPGAEAVVMRGDGDMYGFGNIGSFSALNHADIAIARARAVTLGLFNAIDYCYDSVFTGCEILDNGTNTYKFGVDTDNLMKITEIAASGIAGFQAPMVKKVAPETANYNVTKTVDNNTLFTNDAAAGAVIFTLPGPVAGANWCFSVVAAQTLQISAPVGDKIYVGNTATSAGGNVTNSTIGSSVCLTAVNSTTFVASSVTGSWTAL